MEIQLTPKSRRFVETTVGRGRYASASELVADALRLLEERERILDDQRSTIREKIAEGADAQARGEILDGEAVFARLEREIDTMERDTQTE